MKKCHRVELQNKAGNRTDYIKKYCFSKFLDFLRLSAMIELYLRLFMRLLLIFLSTLLFGAFLLNSQTVFAADRCADASAVNDITCAQFKISLVQLDPVGN